MTKKTEQTVRRVLVGQSPDYFIYPNAAAFAAEGLNAGEVAVVLMLLEDQGTVERERLDEIGGGYRLIRQEGSNG